MELHHYAPAASGITAQVIISQRLRQLIRTTEGGIDIKKAPPTEQAEDEIRAFFSGESPEFRTPLAVAGSPFNRRVWEELQQIPAGETRSYSELARKVGKPEGPRAVARACGANRIALIIPCHRVIGSDGSLTGYGGGIWRKEQLLNIEQRYNDSLNRECSYVSGNPAAL